jgi:hypothetical protein
MANTVLDALSGAQIFESNPLGTVTNQWVSVKSADSETVIALARISSVKSIRTSYPGLLVIASAALLLALAAASSKQGMGAALPIGALGLLFALGYLLSRKAYITFTVGGEIIQTSDAGLKHTAQFVAAVEKAMSKMHHTTDALPS